MYQKICIKKIAANGGERLRWHGERTFPSRARRAAAKRLSRKVAKDRARTAKEGWGRRSLRRTPGERLRLRGETTLTFTNRCRQAVRAQDGRADSLPALVFSERRQAGAQAGSPRRRPRRSFTLPGRCRSAFRQSKESMPARGALAQARAKRLLEARA